MDSNSNNKKTPKKVKHSSVLESLRDIGSDTNKSLKKDLFQGASQDVLKQIFGEPKPQKYSGDIKVGESVEFSELFAGTHEKNQEEKRKLTLENYLQREESKRVREQTNQLRIQLHAIQQELLNLTSATQDLGEQTKIAAMQAPVEPGVYHLVFFEKLLEFVRSFTKKVQDASSWLTETNKRANKINYWAKYKKHGSKFLLSPDHYLTRSAG
jgi:hypothetical protein